MGFPPRIISSEGNARWNRYQALERQLGGGPAATMMELLPPVGWVNVASMMATAGLVLAAARRA